MKTIGEVLRGRDERLSSRAFYIQKGRTVTSICRQMVADDVGAVCVFDGTRFVGVFSERDVVRRVVANGLDPTLVKVEEVMTTSLLIARPEEDFRAVLSKMQQAKVRHLPVVSGDELIGMLSIRDLLSEDAREKVCELEALTDYVYHRPPASL